jgi:hypothetical protein
MDAMQRARGRHLGQRILPQLPAPLYRHNIVIALDTLCAKMEQLSQTDEHERVYNLIMA